MQGSARSEVFGRRLQPAQYSQRVLSHVQSQPTQKSRSRCTTAVINTLANAASLPVKSFDAEDLGESKLQVKVASPSTAKSVVHRHVIMLQQNARQGSANTKTRGEVSGGGKKPFAQKGTGNARQGSSRTPLKPGGGVTFGPKPKDWSIKMNKKERRLAISTALHSAAPSITVIDDIKSKVTQTKTKALVEALNGLGLDLDSQHVLLIVDEVTDHIRRSARNVQRLVFTEPSRLNTYDILRADKIVLDSASLNFINQFYGEESRSE